MSEFIKLIPTVYEDSPEIYLNINGSKRKFYYPEGNSFSFESNIKVLEGNEYPIITPPNYKPEIIFDIGANLGAAALHFHKNYPDAKIYSFEPVTENFETFLKNTSEIKKIEGNNFGLFSSTKSTDIYLGHQQKAVSSTTKHIFSSEKTEKIQLIDVEDYIVKNSINKIDILKIDTEGCEVPILSRLFENGNLNANIIYLEYHSESDRLEIDQILQEDFILGFAETRGFHRGERIYLRKEWLSKYEDFNIQEIKNEKSDIGIRRKDISKLLEFIKEQEKDIYPEEINSMHQTITDQMIKSVKHILELKKGTKILDVGCGQGPALEIFRKEGFIATGITLGEEDLQVCKEKGFDVFKMDMSFLDFKNNSFDLIWARHALEHSIFPFYTLSELYRVLSVDGHLYIEVPSNDSPHLHENNSNHYSVLTNTMWLNLIKRAGFEVVESKTLDLSDEERLNYDRYFYYLCKKTKKFNKTESTDPIYLALSKGENFGWGVCSKYLRQESAKLHPNVVAWDFQEEGDEAKTVSGKVVHALTGLEFESLSKLRGSENFGYTFFENELIDVSVRNAKNYDLVLGGSSWCTQKMQDKGIKNTATLIQGIDPEVFYPVEEKNDEEKFVIFSGGKLELRKGQDLILAAIKILQQKYDDIILMNAWYNLWPKSMGLLTQSKHIQFDLKGESWKEWMENLYLLNGIDPSRIITLDITPNDQLRNLYASTDIGLFPNRCEGGTNLVLMEYMACAKPVIASYNTGHTDILNNHNSYPLKEMKNYKIYNNSKQLWADWWESSVDEIVEKIEFAYNHRNKIKNIGKNAGEHLQKFTWKESAKTLLNIIS